MRRFFLACSLLLSAVLLSTNAFAAGPQDVSYKSGDETVHGKLYLPDGKGPFPALVVIHEWWGVTPWIEQEAADFAAHGYASLVIDLYRGKVAKDPMEAHQLMRGVPQDRAVRDMKAAVTYLQSRPDVRKDRIGAVGWCMGGTYAMQIALADPRLAAVAINYGAPATDAAAVAAMHAAVLGNYGGQDLGITADDIHRFEKTLQAAGRQPDIKIYPDAGHAFENSGNKDGYRPDDAKDAQARMLSFFARTLKG